MYKYPIRVAHHSESEKTCTCGAYALAASARARGAVLPSTVLPTVAL